MTDAELIARLRRRRLRNPALDDAAADRIEVLIAERDSAEAKLAKAVEALGWYDDPSSPGDVARATLAEIKGENHE